MNFILDNKVMESDANNTKSSLKNLQGKNKLKFPHNYVYLML